MIGRYTSLDKLHRNGRGSAASRHTWKHHQKQFQLTSPVERGFFAINHREKIKWVICSCYNPKDKFISLNMDSTGQDVDVAK